MMDYPRLLTIKMHIDCPNCRYSMAQYTITPIPGGLLRYDTMCPKCGHKHTFTKPVYSEGVKNETRS